MEIKIKINNVEFEIYKGIHGYVIWYKTLPICYIYNNKNCNEIKKQILKNILPEYYIKNKNEKKYACSISKIERMIVTAAIKNEDVDKIIKEEIKDL